jgi:hypothetical protein
MLWDAVCAETHRNKWLVNDGVALRQAKPPHPPNLGFDELRGKPRPMMTANPQGKLVRSLGHSWRLHTKPA